MPCTKSWLFMFLWVYCFDWRGLSADLVPQWVQAVCGRLHCGAVEQSGPLDLKSRRRPPLLLSAGRGVSPHFEEDGGFPAGRNISFLGATMWPPSSPDLNPLDYAVWSYIQQEACKSRPSSLTLMKHQVLMAWNLIPPEKIRRFCVRFRACLKSCLLYTSPSPRD